MKMVLAEEGHFVNVVPPVDINGAGATGDRFTMAKHRQVAIILTLGVTGAGVDVTLTAADAFSGGNTEDIGFSYYAEEDANGDVLGDRTTVDAAGFTTATADDIVYVIEVREDELPEDKPILQLNLSDPGAATVVSAVAVLTGGPGLLEQDSVIS